LLAFGSVNEATAFRADNARRLRNTPVRLETLCGVALEGLQNPVFDPGDGAGDRSPGCRPASNMKKPTGYPVGRVFWV